MKRLRSLEVAICLSLLLLGWASAAFPKTPVRVFVSILPQKYFVEKIGGKLVDVSVMVEPGADGHTFEPKPKQMVALSKTMIYFAIGIEFENVWLERFIAINPKMLIVHTDAGIDKISMITHHHGEERHNQDKEVIKDPHIWLSPPLVKIMSQNIIESLLDVDPTHGSIYKANFKKFMLEIDDLDSELRKIFAGEGTGVEFMVFHPAWGYFALAYDLEQVPFEIEGKEPKPAELKHLIQHAKEKDIKVVFVQPQFSPAKARVIADSIGGQIAFVDPLAADWSKNLRETATKFKAALR